MITLTHRYLVLLLTLVAGLSTLSTPTSAQTRVQPVYTDGLAAGWNNFSWAAVDTQATAAAYSGSRSISVSFDAWQALYLQHPDFNTTGFTHLRLYLHGGSTGQQRMALYVTYNENGASKDGPNITILKPIANQWVEVQVPLRDLDAFERTITGITLIDTSGQTQSTFYVDEIALVQMAGVDSPVVQQSNVQPGAAPADGKTSIAIRAQIADPQGAEDIASVTLDARAFGRDVVALGDDGQSSEGQAGDGVYGTVFTVAPHTPPGEYMLSVTATDRAGNVVSHGLGAFVVLTQPGGSVPAALPQRLGWGTNQWSLTPGEDWQVNSGVPWDYVNQYITYEWYADGWGGGFVEKFVQHAHNNQSIPVISVYMMLSTPPVCGESAACYAQKLQNPDAVRTYFDALTEAARQARGDKPVIFQLEPDFYGLMQDFSNQENRPAGVRPDDPSSYPVALNVDGYSNTLAGFGRRMVDVIHQTAPNALVAPHASMWGSQNEPNGVPADQVALLAQRSAAFIDAMGGAQADFLSVEWSDNDAGSGKTPWWDDTNRQLPRPSRAVLWENALSAAAHKQLMLWQVPSGNMELDNSCNHYRDNRAAYAFRHSSDLQAAGVFAIVFGGGPGCTTSPATDGGFIAAQAAIAYAQPAAPASVRADDSFGPSVRLYWDAAHEPDVRGYQISVALENGDVQYVYTVERANTTTLLLAKAGRWEIRVAAYDAMGNVGPASAPTVVTTRVSLDHMFLPLAGA